VSPTEEKPFRLGAGEPLDAAVRRIARQEIETILEQLDGAVDAEAIHEVRKATKRLRALLRLFRDQLGDRRYRQENRVFRDAARALSPTRDAQVIVATIDHLAKRFGEGGHTRPFARVRRAVRTHLSEHASDGARHAKRQVIAAMRRALRRVAGWSVRDDGWRALRPGLCRVYREGHAAWGEATAKPCVPRLHEWRKRTKDLRYALELLEPVWPEVMHAYADEVDQLADRLGEDHDLAMLRRVVMDQSVGDDDRHAMLVVIDGSRQELQASSWPLAARIYEARTRRFVRRFARYWRAWCVEAAVASKDAADESPADVARRAVSGWA
jgi:CHAD domain-containing protein